MYSVLTSRALLGCSVLERSVCVCVGAGCNLGSIVMGPSTYYTQLLQLHTYLQASYSSSSSSVGKWSTYIRCSSSIHISKQPHHQHHQQNNGLHIYAAAPAPYISPSLLLIIIISGEMVYILYAAAPYISPGPDSSSLLSSCILYSLQNI